MAHPEILQALSPTYAVGFLAGNFGVAFFALAAVVLAVTGAEALYADMGHFGRRAITRGWLGLVLPACTLSYFGQGALILGDPSTVSSPFFLLTPEWGRLPMILLATAATVIASQAVITGAFSVAAQAAQLGYLPRLRIAHTSESTIGQIYVPWVNWMLAVAVVTLVFAFRSSAALAYAFGMAVVTTITITTLLFFYLARVHWRTPLWLVVLGGGALLVVDLLFLAANLTKLAHGAWLPLLIGLVAYAVMTTWQRGREIVTRERERAEGPLRAFVDQLHTWQPPLLHVAGTAIFLDRGKETAPLAMRANVEHNRVRHEHVVILSIETRAGAPRPGRRAHRDRRARLRRRRHRPRQRALRLHGDPQRAARARPARPAADRGSDRRRPGLVLPLEDRADHGPRSDDGALAQAAVHRDVLPRRPTPPSTSASRAIGR